MKRVVNFLPVYTEIAFLTEIAIAKHLLRKVAKFYKQAKLTVKLPRNGFKHHAKNLFFVSTCRLIVAFAMYAPLGKQIWRHERATPTYCCQHMGNNYSFVGSSNCHIWRLRRRAFYNAKQLYAMKEVVACHLWQLFAIAYYAYPDVLHNAKLEKY